MKAPVDERELSVWVCGNGQLLAPLALIIGTLLITGADSWAVASGSVILLTVYIAKRWDGMALFVYGIAMLAVCGALIFIAYPYADWAAVQAYWLLATGTAGMALRLIKAPASPRGNQRNRKDIRDP